MMAYHERLNRDPQWALEQGGRFFMGQSEVNAALLRVTKRLTELGIPYALAGGMALFQHGYRRFTEDVDLLIREEDLERIHSELEGRGYLPLFRGSKNLRDTEAGVPIEFLLAGQFPGDGKEKPVSFPDPRDAGTEINGLICINLVSLLEMKLASGMTSTGRLKDLADVQEIAKLLHLDKQFAAKLNPYVRSKFEELVSGLAEG
jgi:hypothetical protein